MEEFQSQIDAFAEQIEQELRDGVLSFPTVFDLSLRIKRLADDPDSSLTDIANAVKAEPVLAAKVIRMANTLSMNPYRGEISSLKEAITRIGLSTLRCLAFAVAAEQLARDHRSRQMRLIATGLWMHAIDVASWAFAFARERERANPDGAMLAGLMLDIGQFYLLARAARYPALEVTYHAFAGVVHGFFTLGKVFPEAHQAVELCARELRRHLLDDADDGGCAARRPLIRSRRFAFSRRRRR